MTHCYSLHMISSKEIGKGLLSVNYLLGCWDSWFNVLDPFFFGWSCEKWPVPRLAVPSTEQLLNVDHQTIGGLVG